MVQSTATRAALLVFGVGLLNLKAASPQQLDQAAVIRGIDAAAHARVNTIAGYTVTEHYAVYRGSDETHSVADMTVKTSYRPETGKNYTVISEGGSTLIRRLGLDPLLDREREINLPANVSHAWITSDNYNMKLKPGIQQINDRKCFELSINPKRKATNLIIGSAWVDAKDFTIVRLQGIASKSPSIFAGTTHMQRDYTKIDGFSMATHARAESSTFVYGRTVVIIDYSGYQIERRPPAIGGPSSPPAGDESHSY